MINSINSLNIQTNQKWNYNSETKFLNTVFDFVDDGDKVVQEKELSLLTKLLNALNKNNKTAQIESTGNSSELAAMNFISGDFEALSQIENFDDFLKLYKEMSGGESLSGTFLAELEAGNMSKEDFEYYLYCLKNNSGEKANSFDDIYNSTVDFLDTKNFVNLESKYASGEIDKEQVDDIKSFIKAEFNRDIDDFRLLDFLSQHLEEYCQEDANYNLKLNVDGIKKALKTEGFFDKNIQEYAQNIPEYAGGPYLAMSEIVGFANNVEAQAINTPEVNTRHRLKAEHNSFGY